MNNDIAKSLTELATLRISHGAVQHARNAVEQAMTTGDLLLEAKEQVQQGLLHPIPRYDCRHLLQMMNFWRKQPLKSTSNW